MEPLRWKVTPQGSFLLLIMNLQIRHPYLDFALLYGQDLLDQSQQAQARDGKKIRSGAGGAESEERLRRSRATAARCQPDAGGKSLRGDGPPPRLHSPLQSFASHFS